MPNIAFKRKEIARLLPLYEKIDDCVSGASAVKARGDKYLPRPDPTNADEENLARYQAYLTRAIFYNASQLTIAGLIGQIFLRDPLVELPEDVQFDFIQADADGTGITLNQQAEAACRHLLTKARAGLLVDYPSFLDDEGKPQGATREQIQNGDARPFIRLYSPLQIINWRLITRRGKVIPSLIVLEEEFDKEDDGFAVVTEKRWRVLRLIDDKYHVQIWESASGNEPKSDVIPTKADGTTFDEIPFMPLGALKNTWDVQSPPSEALIEVNLGHYRNSADYEESIYTVGQPTPWVSGLSEEWLENQMGGVINFGSRAGIVLPPNAEAGILQVEPNTMAKEGMDAKEKQMVALGAKFVEGSSVERTATEADHDKTSENSLLATVAKNVGDAFEWALRLAGEAFMGLKIPKKGDEGAIAFELNTEFDLVKMSPEERKVLLSEWQAGAIAFPELRDNLRRAGVASLEDEKAQELIKQEVASDPMRNPLLENDPNMPPGTPPGTQPPPREDE